MSFSMESPQNYTASTATIFQALTHTSGPNIQWIFLDFDHTITTQDTTGDDLTRLNPQDIYQRIRQPEKLKAFIEKCRKEGIQLAIVTHNDKLDYIRNFITIFISQEGKNPETKIYQSKSTKNDEFIPANISCDIPQKEEILTIDQFSHQYFYSESVAIPLIISTNFNSWDLVMNTKMMFYLRH